MSVTAENTKAADELSLREFSKKGDLEAVNNLLGKKVDASAQGPGTLRTALHWAAKCRKPRVVEALLAAGANQSLRDREGNAPLDLAMTERGNDETIAILAEQLKSTASPDAKQAAELNHAAVTIPYDPKKMLAALRTYKQQNLKYTEVCETVNTDWNKLIASLTPAITQSLFKRQCSHLELSSVELQQFIKFLKELSIASCYYGHLSLLRSEGYTNPTLDIIDQAWKSSLHICGIIFESIRFSRKLLAFKEFAIGTLTSLGVAKPSLKAAKKLLKRVESASNQQLEHLLTTTEVYCRSFIPKPRELVVVVNTYFPGDLINSIVFLRLAIDSLPSAPRFEQNVLADNQAFHTALKQYFDFFVNYLKKIIADNEKVIVRLSILSNLAPNAAQIKATEEALKSFIVNQLHEQFEAITKDPYLQPFNMLVWFFSYAQNHLLHIQSILENSDSISRSLFISQAQALRNKFMADLKAHSEATATATESHAKALAAQKKVAKEKEAKARALAEQDKQKATALIHAKQLADRKIMDENVKKLSHVERILETLDLKEDGKVIAEILGILDMRTTKMEEKAFLALVCKLKIKGYEKVLPGANGAKDNKVTLSIDSLSCTVHCKHGKDKSEMIDPNAIKEFKAMLEGIGINQQNFIKLCKQYSKSIKKPPAATGTAAAH